MFYVGFTHPFDKLEPSTTTIESLIGISPERHGSGQRDDWLLPSHSSLPRSPEKPGTSTLILARVAGVTRSVLNFVPLGLALLWVPTDFSVPCSRYW